MIGRVSDDTSVGDVISMAILTGFKASLAAEAVKGSKYFGDSGRSVPLVAGSIAAVVVWSA